MGYKLSDYNIFVNYDHKHLLFNGLTGALLELSGEARQRIEQERDFAGIAAESPRLFHSLTQTRCIVDEAVNEHDFLVRRNRAAVYQDRVYQLFINPTMNCNFSCWYCYENHVKSRMGEEMKARVIKHVSLLMERGEIQGLAMHWFGGEPLMTFSSVVYPLSKALKDLAVSHGIPFSNAITTNGFLLSEKHMALYREIDLLAYQITLDGDEERHDNIRFLKGNQRPTYARIVENIHMLAKGLEGARINVRINFEKKTLEKIDHLFADFSPEVRSRLNFDMHRVWQTYDESKPGEDTDLYETLMKFEDAGFIAGSSANEFVLHRGKKCYADKWYQAVVNYDGNVYKCTARDFNEANAEGRLLESGEIAWNEEKQNRRFHRSPMARERCRDCKLLPLCMGPCSQQMIEIGEPERNSYCWLDHLELSVADYVIDRYETLKNKSKQMGAVAV